MKKERLKYYSIILMLFCVLSVHGQFFRHYTINDGLSNNAVYSIFQDSKGLMWFGTINGLHSFDGLHISVVKNSSDKITLGNVIYSISEDHLRRLWIASDSGLTLYSLEKGSFLPFEQATDSGVKIHSYVSYVFKDSHNNMWISTVGQGVFCYSANGKLLQYTAGQIPSNNIKHITEDKSGIIWITTIDKGICSYNPLTHAFSSYIDADALKNLVVFEDSQANLWVGNAGKGLFLFDRKNGKFNPVIKPEYPYHMLQIRSIVEYEPGTLLLASDEGLISYSVASGKINWLKPAENNYRGLNDKFLHSLFIDNEKGLWIGTYFGGVNYLAPNNTNFSYYGRSNTSINGRIVSVFAKDEKENLWLGTDDAGLYYWDREKNEFISYQTKVTYENIHALLWDKDHLYVGMYMGGLDVLNLKTGKIKNYNTNGSSHSLYSSGVYALYKDIYGVLWVGTSLGLNCYNPLSDDFTRIEQMRSADVTHILEDVKGFLWVMTLNKGIFRLDRKTNLWENYLYDSNMSNGLPSNKIVTAAIDEEQKLWIGTDGKGLCYFDYDKNIFIPVPLTGAPSDVIYKIIPDHNTLWLSTSNGLLCYYPEQNSWKVYTKYDGLQDDQFSPNGGIKMSDGTLYFGGINGFNGFRPTEIKQNYRPPQLVFTDFSLFNKHVDSETSDSPLKGSITYAEKIVLKNKHSIFSINFAALSYISPLKNRYKYKLDGFEKEWTEIQDIPRASYTNLPAGNYVLRVIGANSDGVWNEKGISLRIKVLPPAWLSLPFIIIYVLLLLGLLYYFLHRMQKEHKKKIEYLEIEKEKQLYDAKIDFFTNVVHEIRTPLSLILAPLDHIMQSTGKITDFMPDLQIIERNAQRLLTLVNQLMDFRKIEEGGIRLNFQTINLNELVADIYTRFKLSADLKNIQLNIALPPKGCYLYTDPDALTKIVSNLLSNALKFTSNTIWIELTEDEKTKQISLRIKDNGIGINEVEQKNIFKPFYQIRQNNLNDQIGTGIGLFLVKSLITLLNATLTLKSEKEEGSEFIIELPAENNNPANSIKEEIAPYYLDNDQLEGRDDILFTKTARNSLLIVDDNADLLIFLSGLFKEQYEVIAAVDGEDALQQLEKKQPDLIISDVMMPKMDGFELCSRIKNDIQTSHIPILLLTAKVSETDQIQGLDYGADVYVAKPFSSDFLKAQVKSLLLNRKRIRDNFMQEPLVALSTVANTNIDKIFLDKMSRIIEENIAEPYLTVDFLAQELCMGRSNFFAKVKGISGVTPNDFIRIIRLKKAAGLLSSEDITIRETCFRVGFTSPSYFTKCFQTQFGITPSDFLKKVRQ